MSVIKLSKDQYERARHLFKTLHYQLAVEAMLDGSNPGWIYVDDEKLPTCAWMVNSEGFFLAGNPTNRKFNAWMEKWFEDYVQHGNKDWESDAVLLFDISGQDWVASFPDIFSLRPPLEVSRMHYLCKAVKVDWRNLLPEGFQVSEIDERVLTDTNLEIPDHLRFWIKMNWGTQRDFLDCGFGTCIVHEGRIVSYSLADCVHENECEIGIQTLAEYRRKGLATITAAANVELAFSRGCKVVGWHTHDYNTASQKTAEKVGFELERTYLQYECHRVEAMHIAERALRFFMKEEHESAAETFEAALCVGEVEAWVYALASRTNARLGNTSRAMELLQSAADKGYSNVKNLRESPDFDNLRDFEEWSAILARVEENS